MDLKAWKHFDTTVTPIESQNINEAIQTPDLTLSYLLHN